MQLTNPQSELLDRMPPASLEAERAVLGSILLESSVFDEVAMVVSAGDFYADANGKLFETISEMVEKALPIDALTLLDQLTRKRQIEIVGGVAYLTEVAQSVPWASNALHYARIVAEKARLRRIVRIAENALVGAYAANGNPDVIVSEIENGIEAVLANREDTVASSSDIAIRLSERIDEIANHKNHIGLLTGFENFDQITGGLFPSEFIILAARPGKGKTALGVQFASNIAESGKPVYFVSLEMPPEDVAQRIVCQRSEVNSKSIRTATMNDGERKAFVSELNWFSNLPLYWETCETINVPRIHRTAKSLVKKRGLRMVVIDYIGLIESESVDEKKAEWERVGKISKGIRKMARALKIPVLCLCQLNREIEEQDRPQLKHLRSSGSIEQDAHVVLFIHKPDGGIYEDKVEKVDKRTVRTKEKKEWDAELIIAKQRNGETGTVRLFWTPQYTRFESWGITRSGQYHDEFASYGGDDGF